VIILDTNVISEPTKSAGNPAVLAWLDRQVAETLFLTSINLAELLAGVARVPEGKRKHGLASGLDALLDTLFGARILAFDANAARAYATISQHAARGGFAIGMADAQIAAIASVHDFTVATRDVAPFVAAGLRVIDPWNPSD